MTDAWVGAVLADRYRIEEPLSEGGMGAVYRARDDHLGRPVAIKVIRAELATETVFTERLEREARLAGSLAHPNIVQTTDFGRAAGGEPFIVMELLEGESLGVVLRAERKLEPSRVVFIVHQILDALHAAHGAGIVHRDLKPMNVFLTELGGVKDAVKLLDFGIAKLMDSDAYQRLTATGQVLGSPSWMAPEQARGEPVDARADLYAVGLIAYRGLAGSIPWKASSQAELLVKIQQEAPRPLSGIEPQLQSAVLRALAKDPDARFASAAEMRAAFAGRLGPEAAERWTTLSGRTLESAPTGAATSVPPTAVNTSLGHDGDTEPDSVPPPAMAPAAVPAPAGAQPAIASSSASPRPKPKRRSRRGLALVLVIVVLLGAAVAVTLAMIPMWFVDQRAVSTHPQPAAPAGAPQVQATPAAAEGPKPTGGSCTVGYASHEANGLYARVDTPNMLMSRSGGLAGCLQHGPPGYFRVELFVGAGGAVQHSSISDAGSIPVNQQPCINQALNAMQLDATDNRGEGTVTITYLVTCTS